MPKILVLADDLTGANDTGAAVRRIGFETCTVINVKSEGDCEECDCISVNLESRGMESSQAAQCVQEAFDRFAAADTQLFAKRIDSTLRGNLGSECDALLDKIGPTAIAVVVPAFPDAGRIYQNGVVYVDGIPLEKTAAACDPKWPMQTSSPEKVLQQQTSRKIFRVPLEIVRQGAPAVSRYSQKGISEGSKYLLFETVTSEDIDTVAEGAVSLGRSFAAVDPGPSTAAVAKKMFCPEKVPEILAVVGSVNRVSKEQVEFLMRQGQAACSQINVEHLLREDKDRKAEIRRAALELAEQNPRGNIRLLMLSSVLSEAPVSFEDYAKRKRITVEAVSKQVNDALSLAAHYVIKNCGHIGAFFTCGGDVTVSFCNELGIKGIRVLDEVIPLAVFGELTACNQKKYFIVTKGGMVGDRQGMAKCMEYLTRKLYKKERF